MASVNPAKELAMEMACAQGVTPGRPLTLILTNRCNLTCSYCLRAKSPEDLPVRLVAGLISQAGELGYRELALSGGETCMHPEFHAIVELILASNLSFSVVSNGFEYDRYDFLVASADRIAHLAFSVDAATPGKHDLTRGSGSFEQVINAARHFSPHLPVQLICVLNRHNLDEMEDLVALAAELGAGQVTFAAVIPWSSTEDIALTDDDARQCLNRIDRINRVPNGVRAVPAASLLTEHIVGFCSSLHSPSPAVMSDGEVSFCCDLLGNGYSVGSLWESSLADILARSRDVAAQLREARAAAFERGEFHTRFDSCQFCNRALGIDGSCH